MKVFYNLLFVDIITLKGGISAVTINTALPPSCLNMCLSVAWPYTDPFQMLSFGNYAKMMCLMQYLYFCLCLVTKNSLIDMICARYRLNCILCIQKLKHIIK